MKLPLSWFAPVVVAGLSILVSPAPFAQGSLTPPAGAPAPTMKTLEQLAAEIAAKKDDARVPLRVGVSPGDSTAQFVIVKPGSYYLTATSWWRTAAMVSESARLTRPECRSI